LIYGYLCRILNIYFFWDSRTLGWITLLIALTGFLIGLKKKRKLQGKKTIWIKIGIVVLIFGLSIMPIVIFMLKSSEAYQSAIEYIRTDPQIKTLVGDIQGFGLIPTGQTSSTTINGAESGEAQFDIIVRGDKKYIDITVSLKKTPETTWKVVSIE